VVRSQGRCIVKLYYSPGACSLAPHIVLEEIGAPYTLELISVAEGNTQSEDYLSINPKGRVPLLECEMGLLTEAPAILLYLSLSNPNMQLLPKGPDAIARAMEWLNWISSDLHGIGFGALWRPNRFVKDAAIQKIVSAEANRNIFFACNRTESLLAGKLWALGSAYSCVDPYLLVFYRWGNRIGKDMRSDYPVWTKHAEAVAGRPASVRALEQESISIW